MDSAYWQVLAEEEARKRLALFTLEGNWRWKVIPMGDLHLEPIFLSNDDEATDVMRYTIQRTWLENFCNKNYCR